MSQKQHITALAYNKRGRLLSIGLNSYTKTHPLQAKFASKTDNPNRVFLHAELAALIKAQEKVHKLVVIRYDRHGKPANCKPCECCQRAIKHYGVKYVEHT